MHNRNRRQRRIKSEINMVPFIDVMLVLLIVFMVSATLLPTGVVDLPSISHAKKTPEKVIEVVVEGASSLSFRIDGRQQGQIALSELAERIKIEQHSALGGADKVPVIISARKNTDYQSVMQVMDVLQKGGVARVGLSVKTTGG